MVFFHQQPDLAVIRAEIEDRAARSKDVVRLARCSQAVHFFVQRHQTYVTFRENIRLLAAGIRPMEEDIRLCEGAERFLHGARAVEMQVDVVGQRGDNAVEPLDAADVSGILQDDSVGGGHGRRLDIVEIAPVFDDVQADIPAGFAAHDIGHIAPEDNQLVGPAISTVEQRLDHAVERQTNAGCAGVFREHVVDKDVEFEVTARLESAHEHNQRGRIGHHQHLVAAANVLLGQLVKGQRGGEERFGFAGE